MPEKPMLLGLETEYAVSGHSGASPVMPEQLAELLCQQARRRFRHLPDLAARSGMFLENGARFYSDINGHPEFATPECSTPGQVVLFDLAGEQMLHRLAGEVLSEQRFTAICVRKNNVCSVEPGGATWGNHESYTCWVALEQAARALVPFLVTRLPFAGAGCLSANPNGMGFELSQRSQHLSEEVGSNTTNDRAIFCTRVRKSSDASPDGWIRIHLICKDSSRAPLGTFLTMGVTGLLIWILNQGGRVGRCLRLLDPVGAIHAVSLDPWLQKRLPVSNGRQLTALEIQELYLADCERFAQRHSLPEWGCGVLKLWSDILQSLRRNPTSLAGELDTCTKLLVYEHELQRQRATWRDLQRGLQMLAHIRHIASGGVVQSLLTENAGKLRPTAMPALLSAKALVQADGPGALDRLRLALRLQSLDLRYHELGGLYEQFTAQCPAPRLLVRPTLIEQAQTTPPPRGRASLRAAEIKAHHGQRGWAANWQHVVNQVDQTAVDLGGPFSTSATTMPLAELEKMSRRDSARMLGVARRALREEMEHTSPTGFMASPVE